MSYKKEKQALLRAQLRLEWGATLVTWIRVLPILAILGAMWALEVGYIPWP
jgi:hypothetical protein